MYLVEIKPVPIPVQFNGREIAVQYPTHATLLALEQWFKKKVGRVVPWWKIIAQEETMFIDNFVEFAQIIFDPGNNVTLDEMKQVVSGVNLQTILEICRHALNGTQPPSKEGDDEKKDPASPGGSG